MKHLFTVIVFTFSLTTFGQSCCSEKTLSDNSSARCTGSASCRACTNCSRCAHCSNGGTCGVCVGTSSGRSKPTYSTPRTSGSGNNSGSSGSGIYRPNIISGSLVQVSVNELNMREQPNTNSKIIKKLKNGIYLTVLEIQNDWVKVKDDDNDEGWVYSKYVK